MTDADETLWFDSRTPIEIEGAHSPFLSRPRELAELLLDLADDLGQPASAACSLGSSLCAIAAIRSRSSTLTSV
jgi:hypothetical protein